MTLKKVKANKGYRQKGKYNNKGKHLGWYKNGKIAEMLQPGEKVDVTYYLNDVSAAHTQVLMTYGEEGNFNAAYTYGLERIEVEALDATRPEAQDPLYYLYDGLGSVTYMVKPDGNKRDHYRYDAFGKPAPGNSKLSEDGRIVNHNTFGYTGEMWDQEAELLYLRARYYEPETGRFLSRDNYHGDLKDPLSRNLYSYVQNNPMSFIDPSGHAKLFINGTPTDVTINNGSSYISPTTLASEFGLSIHSNRGGSYYIYPSSSYMEGSNFENVDGQISIRQFAETFGIPLSYNKLTNSIYLGAQPCVCDIHYQSGGTQIFASNPNNNTTACHVSATRGMPMNQVELDPSNPYYMAGCFCIAGGLGTVLVSGTYASLAPTVAANGDKVISSVNRVIPNISNSQLGKKLVDHAADYGLKISKEGAMAYRSITEMFFEMLQRLR